MPRTATTKSAATKATGKGSQASAERPMPGFKALEPRARLTDLAYETLEEAIVTLKLPPGTAISEQTLADMTGIGRTPVREAIQRLAREHLIVILPQRGLLITDVMVSRQLLLLETRRELERLICTSAAKRATPAQRQRFAELAEEFRRLARQEDSDAFMQADRDFNEQCLAAARNPFTESAMRSLHGLSRRFWFIHYKQSPDLPKMAELHASVSDAIARADVQGAGQGLDRLIDFIEQYTRSAVLPDG